jgi:rod shape-determining protein MreC
VPASFNAGTHKGAAFWKISMQLIFQLIIKYRSLASLFLTVSVSLWMLSSNAESSGNITSALTMTIFYPFQYSFQQAARIRNIFAENRRMREELTSLRITASFLSGQGAENNRLREMLAFRDSIPFSLVAARVIARETSPFCRSVVINAGKSHGVELFMPVVTHRGVVGKIVRVLPRISMVQLLNDPSARISVLTSRTRAPGILETEDGRVFFVQHRKHLDVIKGDTLITSGLGGIYPKGLNAGVVSSVEETKDPLFKKTILSPSVDFDRMEDLFVMKLPPEWTAVRAELDSTGIDK